MSNNERRKELLEEVKTYLRENKTEFIKNDKTDDYSYLCFLHDLTSNINTNIDIDVLEDHNEVFWQATVYKNWYIIILTMQTLKLDIKSELDYVNYIIKLEEEAERIKINILP